MRMKELLECLDQGVALETCNSGANWSAIELLYSESFGNIIKMLNKGHIRKRPNYLVEYISWTNMNARIWVSEEEHSNFFVHFSPDVWVKTGRTREI